MKSLTRGYLKTGLDSIRGMKWRNFWTILGVVIGVASVITVIGIGNGIKQQLSNQFKSTSSNIISIRPGSRDGGQTNALGLLSGFNAGGNLSKKDANIVSTIPGVNAETPLNAFRAHLKGDIGKYPSGLVIGSNQNLPSLINQSVASGAYLSSSDMGSNNVVLGAQAATALFKETIPIGQLLYINGQQFIVKGVMNSFPNTPLSQDAYYNKAVFISYDTAERLTQNTASTFEILARPSKPKLLKPVSQAIKRALLRAHGGDANFTVFNSSQSIAQNSSILNMITALTTGIAAISLIVGGVGIMNVMLVSVTERMHEIGIRKAIGATDRQILSQFIIESAMLSLSGGIIGIIISFVVEGIITVTTPIRPLISWQAVLFATVVSFLIGIIFGSVPALKAARKDPISALRAE